MQEFCVVVIIRYRKTPGKTGVYDTMSTHIRRGRCSTSRVHASIRACSAELRRSSSAAAESRSFAAVCRTASSASAPARPAAVETGKVAVAGSSPLIPAPPSLAH